MNNNEVVIRERRTSSVTPNASINLPLDGWRRIDEVLFYAQDRKIGVQEAIIELVNKGLNRVDPPWKRPNVDPWRGPR